ncbi:pyridine nucleotide-disulfide oxidoreductase [Legionella dresdenensis]|uniref:Pyridine nucleotide-disulfide oxidoreductase n=1 Tax=Legionella dresdenensis TaxID=450200 RepID=A0ABV8CHT4_9GAMM
MNKKPFEWAVIGAGPAGIAAVGRLIDHDIPASEILWLDPHFKVGDLGALWRNVSSNTTVARFLAFLQASAAFGYQSADIDFNLNHLPLEETCILADVVEPLQWVTNRLLPKVASCQTLIHHILLKERLWQLTATEQSFLARNVILANGAAPSTLNYPGIQQIPFETAIDKEQLAACISPGKTYGVFGSSHSAIIIIRYLVELGVEKIINFYRSPCKYALDMGDWILFDNTGLKGQTALWARENIDGTYPPGLNRYPVNEHSIARHLPECDQVIYAVGFEQRRNLDIGGYENADYNSNTGIIAPGLFGFGIGYPETKADPFGTIESQVGLWKFMVYLNKVLPIWLQYHT